MLDWLGFTYPFLYFEGKIDFSSSRNGNGTYKNPLNFQYKADRGAHTYWLKKGSADLRPDHALNLIHYEVMFAHMYRDVFTLFCPYFII